MYYLTDNLLFPPVELADENGIIAIGGDLSPERLILAYKSGIFPWYNSDEPIIWYSPNPRMVLYPKHLKISKSMHQLIGKKKYNITYNQNFSEVIANCKKAERKGQKGTWITDSMEKSYQILHEMGYAKSVEVWNGSEMIGGLYGIDLGTVFCGESMFSKVSNASKLAFINLTEKLVKENYTVIDCQVYNDHLASLGAEEIPRNEFIKLLEVKP